MKKSESIKELSAALAKFQGAIRAIPRNAENPFFHSTYADLAAIWDTIRKPLADHGLSVVQGGEPNLDGGTVAVSTTLLHTSGEWIESTFVMTPTDSKPISVGSAITYGRRYGLAAIIGVVAESEDDDGMKASEGVTKPVISRQQQPRIQKAPCAPSKTPPIATGGSDDKGRIIYECPECGAHNTMYSKEDGSKRFSCPADCPYWWTDKPAAKKGYISQMEKEG